MTSKTVTICTYNDFKKVPPHEIDNIDDIRNKKVKMEIKIKFSDENINDKYHCVVNNKRFDYYPNNIITYEISFSNQQCLSFYVTDSKNEHVNNIEEVIFEFEHIKDTIEQPEHNLLPLLSVGILLLLCKYM